ncbi:MAG TPA: glutamate-5-semialdehyde dehydrogenase [Methanomassiliicoccales archaeon]|nr:glutamate-5-semialdehyde dehydrogenase [Methanomassiliicoccales archaeon]
MDAVEIAARKAKEASYRLQSLTQAVRNEALQEIAAALQDHADDIVKANQADVKEAEKAGLPKVLVKRLRYDQAKIKESVDSLRSLIKQEDPIGKVVSRTELDSGLVLERMTCPIGVIGVIFEARPEALVQISSLCLKSGNAVMLKGGSEAHRTNEALAKVILTAVTDLDERFASAVQLLSTREEINRLLAMDQFVDLIIPRGSNQLVRFIKEHTKIPVLGHADGICHTYVDESADLEMAIRVCFDAKVQYPAVCNAMETMLVHENVALTFIPAMAERFHQAGVELRGDEGACSMAEMKEASEEDWSTEYNDLVLSVKIVSTLEEAVQHINRYGSHHSDAIIAADERAAQRFMDEVDSSSVMWNCSTRFADGYRYGLGAEVGISTNKTHARGPVGLEGLTIYKYRLRGSGHVVSEYVGEGARQFTHRKLL